MNHITEEAELYALGVLEPDERERVDEHVSICDSCARRLGRAEAAIATLVEATVPLQAAPPTLAPRVARLSSSTARIQASRPRRYSWAAAAAAAFALSTGVLTQQHLALVSAVDADGASLRALVHSHFAHAQFVAPNGTPIDAKLLYERHGMWYEVVASPGSTDWSVAVRRGDAAESVVRGRFAARGDSVYMRFLDAAGVSEIELRDGTGRVLGVVRPQLAHEPQGEAGESRVL
ncbi:MAG: anti-sigma factor [Candidatus Velthaea sp.]